MKVLPDPHPAKKPTMFKKVLLLFMTLAVCGCTFFRSPGREKCDKLLSREKMTDLLMDIYLLEGYFLELQPFNPNIQDSVADYYAGLLERHGVSFQEFELALSCYLLHEREMQLIHEELLQRYSIMESQAEPYMPDSISGKIER